MNARLIVFHDIGYETTGPTSTLGFVVAELVKSFGRRRDSPKVLATSATVEPQSFFLDGN